MLEGGGKNWREHVNHRGIITGMEKQIPSKFNKYLLKDIYITPPAPAAQVLGKTKVGGR